MHNYSKSKQIWITVLGGWFGLHYYLDNKIGKGILYTLTVGLFEIGWFIDIYKVCKKQDLSNKNSKHRKKRVISDNNYKEIYMNYVPKEVYAESYMQRKTIKKPDSYVVFDTETTGLEVDVEKIIELSAIKYINHKKVEEFSILINPQRKLEPFITQLTGIRQEDLNNQPSIEEVLPEFYKFIEDYTLIAHNAPFDIKILACESYRYNIKLMDNKIIDTLPLAKRLFNKNQVENYKLETIKNYLGLAYDSHRALDDCETCATLYQCYCTNFRG